MRKHKSVVAILLAVMMIFTFMPTMAFAGEASVEWAKDFRTAEYNGRTLTANLSFASSGLTTATVSYDNNVISTRYFYDFTGATLSLSANMSANIYKGLNGDNATVIMVKPEGATGNATATTDSFTGWTVKYKTDQEVTEGAAKVEAVVASTQAGTDYDGTANMPVKFGSIAAKDVTVDAAVEADPAWYELVDGEKSERTTAFDFRYDGKEHTLVAGNIANYNLSKYQKWSAEDAAWVDVAAVSYKDADSEGTQYKAIYTAKDATKTTPYVKESTPITVTVRATRAYVYYKWTAPNTLDGYVLTEKEAADPYAFVEFSNTSEIDTDDEAIKAYFADRYEIKVTKNAIDANQQTWEIVDKYSKMTEAEQKAFVKAHKTLIDNYSDVKSNGLRLARNSSATVDVVISNPVIADKDDDVTITFAPNKTYKAKKKTKKLAANKSFTLEANTESGKAVQWLITKGNKKISIDEATGKITVKKGLKKGTYSVKVKAKTVAGDGYKAAKDTVTIKVKVK